MLYVDLQVAAMAPFDGLTTNATDEGAIFCAMILLDMIQVLVLSPGRVAATARVLAAFVVLGPEVPLQGSKVGACATHIRTTGQLSIGRMFARYV